MGITSDRIVVITGANSGIGRAAALRFAREGYRVVMACRDLGRSRIAQKELIELSGNPGVDLLEVDLSSFESIRRFCSALEAKYEKLDILIHNAGYFRHGEKRYQLSPDGIELSFATNAFGPFLMTQLLVDMLKGSGDARVLNACTTNIRHFFDPKRKIDFDNLRGEYAVGRPYNSYKLYGDSKMALLMLTFKMADQLKGDGIKVNAVQIPAIKLSKETMRKFKSVWRIAAAVQNIFSAPPETMADSYYHICTSREFGAVTGRLINDRRGIMQPSYYADGFIQGVRQLSDKCVYPRFADDAGNLERVWRLAVELTGVGARA